MKYTTDLFEEKEHLFMSIEKAEEVGRVLNLLKEFEVDIWLLKICDYDNYCRIRTECLKNNVNYYDDDNSPCIPLPTEEDYNFLQQYFEEDEL